MTDVLAAAEELTSLGETEPRLARDPVNQPQVHTWLEAMGDAHPAYRDTPEAVQVYGGPVAPVAMHQVWTMYGLGLPGEDPAAGRAGDPLHQMMGVLDEAGYTSVLGTNSDQTYDRLLKPGEQPSVTTRLESVVGPKRTGVGEGWFVTTRSTWRVGDEQVGSMLFRVLKFKPAARKGPDLTDPARTDRPSLNRDNAYFFEGTSVGELRIQRCNACGALRHPPGPVCPECHAMDRGWVVAAGTGRVYSFIEHHAPQIPGKKLPLLLAVVELDEGVRMIGELRGVSRGDVEIGMPVQVGFDRIDDELTLAFWEPEVGGADGFEAQASPSHLNHRGEDVNHREGTALPPWELPVTRTLVVSTALATRDFQDVHHDPVLSVQKGTKDIFLNILTTTGLVQRYVTDWALAEHGPAARVTACDLRLGAPAYPDDTLALVGRVAEERETDQGKELVIDVVGRVSLGAHATSRVTLVVPR
jgi:uncharacterized OB-fold protein